MVYVTGDTHGSIDFEKLRQFSKDNQGSFTRGDYLIVAGDFGAVWSPDTLDEDLKEYRELPFTVLFVDGNHENFNMLGAYPVEEWNGGKIHKIADNIFHLMRGQIFDIDGAGRKATLRNVDVLVKSGLDVKVVSLDDGKDPDETVRMDGVESFYKHLEEALSVTEYKLKLCENAYDLNTYDGRTKYVKAALDVIGALDESSEQEVYLDLVSRLGRASKDKLYGMLGKKTEAKAEAQPQERASKELASSRFVINCIMQNKKFVDLKSIDSEWFLNPTHKAIFEYALTVPKFIIGNMFSVIEDSSEINEIINVNLKFANEKSEEVYFKDCLLAIANDSISNKLGALIAIYNTLGDADEKRKAVSEISLLQRKLKSRSLEDKH